MKEIKTLTKGHNYSRLLSRKASTKNADYYVYYTYDNHWNDILSEDEEKDYVENETKKKTKQVHTKTRIDGDRTTSVWLPDTGRPLGQQRHDVEDYHVYTIWYTARISCLTAFVLEEDICKRGTILINGVV